MTECRGDAVMFSPAFCGGLIEAAMVRPRMCSSRSFPPHSAGASLKHLQIAPHQLRPIKFSPAFCGGLIEARNWELDMRAWILFSPAFCGGLIEANEAPGGGGRIPGFSPAFCGGLIEARTCCATTASTPRFPPHSAGASLKLDHPRQPEAPDEVVFPRILRGPH